MFRHLHIRDSIGGAFGGCGPGRGPQVSSLFATACCNLEPML